LRSSFRNFKDKMEAQQEEQAQEFYNRVAELEAHVMDVSGSLEGEFYPAYLTGRRWLLTHGVELAMVKCSLNFRLVFWYALSLWKHGKNDQALSVMRILAASIKSLEPRLASTYIHIIKQY
ncbi:hypothetical protein Tco_0346836, partial [Tanacetum coccineum]